MSYFLVSGRQFLWMKAYLDFDISGDLRHWFSENKSLIGVFDHCHTIWNKISIQSKKGNICLPKPSGKHICIRYVYHLFCNHQYGYLEFFSSQFWDNCSPNTVLPWILRFLNPFWVDEILPGIMQSALIGTFAFHSPISYRMNCQECCCCCCCCCSHIPLHLIWWRFEQFAVVVVLQIPYTTRVCV